jgi:anti-sigma factor RsiW
MMRLLRPDPLACQEFVELVTDYLEGALPRRERRRFEAHVGGCDGCEAYLQQMRVTIRSLGELPPEPPRDPETREHLLRAFRELRG